jgi:type IV pilus assembly protein PilW
MKITRIISINARSIAQHGFTLIELMIALLIALFLIGGLVTLVGAMKITFANQNGLSQLQESERMAMTLMTDVIESTGYFPNPVLNTAASSFPVTPAIPSLPVTTPPFTFPGQALVGTGTYANQTALGQTITVRYLTAGNDNVINCAGNTSNVAASFVNTFSIDVNGNLNCTLILNGAAQPPIPLINGLNSMQIYYGVQTNTGVSTNSIDAYMDANAVAGSLNWSNVKSVKIKLTFVNPMFGQAGQAAQQFITFERVIDVMNKTS